MSVRLRCVREEYPLMGVQNSPATLSCITEQKKEKREFIFQPFSDAFGCFFKDAASLFTVFLFWL